MYKELIDNVFGYLGIPLSILLNLGGVLNILNSIIGIVVGILTITWLIYKCEESIYRRKNRNNNSEYLDE